MKELSAIQKCSLALSIRSGQNNIREICEQYSLDKRDITRWISGKGAAASSQKHLLGSQTQEIYCEQNPLTHAKAFIAYHSNQDSSMGSSLLKPDFI